MDSIKLQIIDLNNNSQELVLYSRKVEFSISNMTNSNNRYIFRDKSYAGKLICEDLPLINNVQIYINNNLVDSECSDNGEIIFKDKAFGNRIFVEYYGFVQIMVSFEYKEKIIFFESEYVQVMVQKSMSNQCIDKMINYIYKYEKLLLFSNSLISKTYADLDGEQYRIIDSYLHYLNEFFIVFNQNYNVFNLNSRYKMVSAKQVDRFEKIRYITEDTIQYIIQHPDELCSTNNKQGIKINNKYYLPNKTLVSYNVLSFNIYENKIIIGFLFTICNEIKNIIKKIDDVIKYMPQSALEIDDYISSSYLIYIHTTERLRNFKTQFVSLKEKFEKLYFLYKQIFNLDGQILLKMPRATPIFMNIAHYRLVFDCIQKWFSLEGFSLEEEEFMLSLAKISSLYEVYSLLKMINYFQKKGFKLDTKNKQIYSFPFKTLYENTKCNNIFIFKNEYQEITLYYQPVIYANKQNLKNGIGIYRNNSIPFDNKGFQKGLSYYAPDYLIKYNLSGGTGAKYLIIDAKFSTVRTIQNYQISNLVYKYLFSLSTYNLNDSIVGLYIMNGQIEKEQEEKDKIINIYDCEFEENPICPKAIILTLSEGKNDNEGLHLELFNRTIGSFTL